MMEGEDSKVRICEILRTGETCGFNLTKSKWDPYPWISSVDEGSPAELAGVQAGDCLLEVNGEDILGLRVVDVGGKVKAREDSVTVMLWNAGVDPKCTPEALCCGPMPVNLQRLSSCVSNILAALECPICLDTIAPPAHQCVNGHLVCLNCRVRTEKCCICRTRFCRGRSLLADQVFNSLIEAFELKEVEETERSIKLREKLIGFYKKKNNNQTKNFIPKNKFLTRIIGMGKSSSVENLSSQQIQNIENEQDFCSNLKIKSLSSNEIFRSESQPVSRTPSVISNRAGSGLLQVCPIQLSKRPASYHGSSDNLHKLTDIAFEYNQACNNNGLYHCPVNIACQDRFSLTNLVKHIQYKHGGPVIQYYQPNIEITNSLTCRDMTTLFVSCYDNLFIVKIEEQVTFKLVSDWRVWCWIVGEDQLADKYRMVVSVKHDDNQQLGVSLQTNVISLVSHSLSSVIDQGIGITINSDIARTVAEQDETQTITLHLCINMIE